jgi:hypothetical protein
MSVNPATNASAGPMTDLLETTVAWAPTRPMIDTYPGINGRQQGDRKDSTPAAIASK